MKLSVQPLDEHNTKLVNNVHPDPWPNPTPEGRYNLVVVGGGTAGLISAAIAASMGARTALVERAFLGGDCLNVGCVPSKAIIRGARAQSELGWLDTEGLLDQPIQSRVDFPAVMERLRRIRAGISSHDSAARYRDEFGVDMFIGQGTFESRSSLVVTASDGSKQTLEFSKAIIATGARAAAPPIPGLESTPYLTNETIFSLTSLPQSLLVVGAGPIGCEMAQSFARLGTRVDLVERSGRILPREDEVTARVVQEALIRDGVNIHTDAGVSSVQGEAGHVTLTVTEAGSTGKAATTLEGEQLLIAIGRAPNMDGLGLEAAGVSFHPRGVTVNDSLQTSNRRIYAAGDIAIPYQFTHTAEASAAIVVQNALFARTARFSKLTIPWCTYTSPEIAHVGLNEQQARAQGADIVVYEHAMGAVDRAKLDGQTEGLVRIICKQGSTRILGATIVAEHAGEMIAEIVLAMKHKLGVDALASVIHPYPTQAEAVKRAAAGYLRARLTPRTKRLLGRWFRFSR